MLAPPSFEVLAPLDTPTLGVKASAPQSFTWNGLDRLWLAPNVEFSTDSVASGAQLVGLNRKLGRLTATFRLCRRSGTPPTMLGSVLVTVTRPLYRPTPMPARVTTSPRLYGPATAGTTIDRP